MENKVVEKADVPNEINKLKNKKDIIEKELKYIDSLINTLKTTEKEVITLRYKDNIEAKEIAKIVDKTENAVHKIIKRGTKELDKKYK